MRRYFNIIILPLLVFTSLSCKTTNDSTKAETLATTGIAKTSEEVELVLIAEKRKKNLEEYCYYYSIAPVKENQGKVDDLGAYLKDHFKRSTKFELVRHKVGENTLIDTTYVDLSNTDAVSSKSSDIFQNLYSKQLAKYPLKHEKSKKYFARTIFALQLSFTAAWFYPRWDLLSFTGYVVPVFSYFTKGSVEKLVASKIEEEEESRAKAIQDYQRKKAIENGEPIQPISQPIQKDDAKAIDSFIDRLVKSRDPFQANVSGDSAEDSSDTILGKLESLLGYYRENQRKKLKKCPAPDKVFHRYKR